MSQLKRFVRMVEALNEAVGRIIAWLTLAMIMVTFFVVVMRYGFSWGRVWIQETYVWMHGIVFMVGAGYTLLHDGHVRVDVFYRPAGIRHKAWVDLLGSLILLMPMVILIFIVSFDYVLVSWARLEASREAGGLPGLFLLKTVIWIFCLLVGLQGLAMAGRSFLVLRGDPTFVAEAEKPEQKELIS
ncbi:MAG: TRAP transporter small permease subunit [Geminicoccaceae bacterium]